MGLGSDRAIIERQKKDAKFEVLVASNLEQNRVVTKADWENKTGNVQRNNAIQRRVADVMRQRHASLIERKARLGELLAQEQRKYEREMVEKEETPQERVAKMTKRAFELKKVREEQRQRIVQEKLYQQWREGVDELRKADSNLFEMEVLATRDNQVFENLYRQDEEQEANGYYNKLWMEGYKAKLEREKREEEIRIKQNAELSKVLSFQVAAKDAIAAQEKAHREEEAVEVKALFSQYAKEATEEQLRNVAMAKQERRKVNEFAEIQKRMKENEAAHEAQMDKDYILNFIKEQKEQGQRTHKNKCVAKDDALRYKREAEERKEEQKKKDAEEEAMHIAENMKQWDKRELHWNKEAEAREALLVGTFEGRSKQVEVNKAKRDEAIAEIGIERSVLDAKIEELTKLDEEKDVKEDKARKGHQDELCRQMDFHQVQRMREMQQFKLERRQGEIQEQKFQKAILQERKKLTNISAEIRDARQQKHMDRQAAVEEKERQLKSKHTGVVAPWEK